MREVQLDGLPGPTLIHGGLGHGNLASQANANAVARPRAGARACLAKMRTVMGLGVAQAFLPPLMRPDAAFLAAIGCTAADAPADLLACAGSTAYQWTANAGTVAPATDTVDGVARIVPANLAAQLHRALECGPRAAQLKVLPFAVGAPLPLHPRLGDEGAANHSRVVGPQGVCHLFIHGDGAGATRFTPRQTLAASEAVARRLGLPESRRLFVRQHPAALDAGAFHNDVVMVGDGDRLLLHARAWHDQEAALAELARRCGPLRVRVVDDDELTLDQAVACYLFNSQLLSTPEGTVLVAPAECAEGRPAAVLRRLVDEGFIVRAVLVDVRESMRGGGGPACLRLRLPLPDADLPRVAASGLLLDDARLARLEAWVDRHYREILAPGDLRDPALAAESALALARLPGLLEEP